MCSRFDLNSPPTRLVDRFGLTVPPPLPNKSVMRPTDLTLVVRAGPPGARVPELRPWGLAVEWGRRPIINARAESLAQKPTFRKLLEHRILVPADRYTEWQASAGAGRTRKIPHHIYRPDGDLLGFAGLIDDEGRFTLITCAPAASVAHIHDRMPAILPDPAAEAAWLDPARPFTDVATLLGPYPHPLVAVREDPLAGAAKPLDRNRGQGDLFDG